MSQVQDSAMNGAHEVDEVFRKLVLNASLAESEQPVEVIEVLRKHLGCDPIEAAQASDRFEGEFRLTPFQAGLEVFLAEKGRKHEYVGVDAPVLSPYFTLTLAHLMTPASLTWAGATLSAPSWEQLPCGYDRYMRCLKQAIILLKDKGSTAAIWVTTSWANLTTPIRHITVISADAQHVRRIVADLNRLTLENSPYIGEMFRVSHSAPQQYLQRPEPMTADDVIMPAGLLERIDQHAIGVTLGADRLTAAGQHLKRGLLLYGPPGSGKTHTMRYLSSRLPKETTIVIVDPNELRLVKDYLPFTGPSSMVLLDDVDSIAQARSLPGVRDALFALLETLDGVHGHGDVLFVLTTNRLDALEPAVSARPGRIDEALEVPRPDDDCRRRLFARYRQGMDLDIADSEIDTVVERTKGVTGSFFKEMFRRSTVIAVSRTTDPADLEAITVTGDDVMQALDEMLDPDNPVTSLLLGADPEHVVHKVIVKPTGATR